MMKPKFQNPDFFKPKDAVLSKKYLIFFNIVHYCGKNCVFLRYNWMLSANCRFNLKLIEFQLMVFVGNMKAVAAILTYIQSDK